jgi:hypothetical protein
MRDPAGLLFAAELDWIPFSGILFVLLGLAAFFYGIAPLILLAQQKFEARPRMVRFDLRDYEWPAEIERLFTEATAALRQEGFDIAECVFLPTAVPNVKTAVVLLVNREESDSAIVTAMYAQPVTATSLRTLYVEFSTRSDDDAVFDTNNSSQLGAFPQRERTDLYQFVRVADARMLYRLHAAILQRHGCIRSRRILRLDHQYRSDAVAWLQDSMIEEFEAAAQAGYLRLTDDRQFYRPTLKGAYLIVWKELWPWKMVRRIRRDQKAQALLADLQREGIDLTLPDISARSASEGAV